MRKNGGAAPGCVPEAAAGQPPPASRVTPRATSRHSKINLALFAILAAGVTHTAADASDLQPTTYEQIEVTLSGSVAGIVRAATMPPLPASIRIFKDQSTCGESIPNEAIVRSPDGGLRNAVVALDGITKGKAPDPSAIARLESFHCRFVPRVIAMAVGQRLEVVNSDPIRHTARARIVGVGTIFDVALPVQNQKIPKTIRQPGLMIVKCDAEHPWALAYIKAFEHPYFAVTDDRGAFRIDRIPPGTYRLTAWQEELGAQSIEVIISGGVESAVTFDHLVK